MSDLHLLYVYVGCGDQLIATSTPQTISSPGSPSYYPRDLGCSWYINSPPGTQIFLEFSSFDLDSYDYFTVSITKRFAEIVLWRV